MWCSSVVLPMWFSNHFLKRSFCPKSMMTSGVMFCWTYFKSRAWKISANLMESPLRTSMAWLQLLQPDAPFGERFGMDSTQVVTKRKTLSLEVPGDDYSKMLLVRHENRENICGSWQNVPAFEACPWPLKRWVIILIIIELNMDVDRIITSKIQHSSAVFPFESSQENPQNFPGAPPPNFRFLLRTINKLDPDFRAGGLTHLTVKTKSIASRLIVHVQAEKSVFVRSFVVRSKSIWAF